MLELQEHTTMLGFCMCFLISEFLGEKKKKHQLCFLCSCRSHLLPQSLCQTRGKEPSGGSETHASHFLLPASLPGIYTQAGNQQQWSSPCQCGSTSLSSSQFTGRFPDPAPAIAPCFATAWNVHIINSPSPSSTRRQKIWCSQSI